MPTRRQCPLRRRGVAMIPRSVRRVVCVRATARHQRCEFKAGISDAVNTVLAWSMARAARPLHCAGPQCRYHQHERRQQGRRGMLQAGRIDVMHVGLFVGGEGQSGRRRLADHRLAVERHPLHVLFRTGRQDRRRPQGRRGRSQHIRLGERSDCDARLARKLGLKRDDVVIKEYGGGTPPPGSREVRRDQGHRDQ